MLENCIGLLVWVCGGIYWLKPWLQPFYHLLFKPRCVFRALSCAQFALMKSSLNTKLWLQSSSAVCDLLPGGRSGGCALGLPQNKKQWDRLRFL